MISSLKKLFANDGFGCGIFCPTWDDVLRPNYSWRIMRNNTFLYVTSRTDRNICNLKNTCARRSLAYLQICPDHNGVQKKTLRPHAVAYTTGIVQRALSARAAASGASGSPGGNLTLWYFNLTASWLENPPIIGWFPRVSGDSGDFNTF